MAPSMTYAADIDSIKDAQKRIAPYAHVTPVLTSSSVDGLAKGRSLHFKCEVFQKGGSFKFRGACNSIFSLSDEDARHGVVTHSSGNHAAACALAASLRNISAHIVVPNGAPECKVAAVRRYGGDVVFCEPTLQAREEAASLIQKKTGAIMIPPFNYGPTISGQGTIALELLEQVPDLEAIVVPISGGGMISGIAIAAKALKPGIRIIAAEPAGANDAALSKAAGKCIPCTAPKTIADGLRASLGDLTWPVVRDLVDAVVTVDDKEIVAAMKVVYEQLKVAVEPSGAVGLAAVLSSAFHENEEWKDVKNVGVVLCGGNLDLSVLWDALNKSCLT
ncbi:serine racemase [Klebsormidium nitens]|uniref:Serine racemase n=1 Tax=Klebsormidium nitens TaxID=105231 RepID=A0A1Y1I7P4_KLENI|nr:serine racemase [Klebsormidium nitens]|eukprot:GAQ84128.1 serine racemase [Klebsormidium nitens]